MRIISLSYVRGSESDELLAAIFSLWISIRGFSFASFMLETYKKERQLLVKGLRKNLAKEAPK